MNNNEWYVILNMNCKYEICRMCPKSGLFKGSYEECEKWIEQKEEKLDEMKSKISLALKDPILQLGFELICKENAELKERILTLEQIKKEHSDYTIRVEEERTCAKEQLTKAKEFLQDILDFEDGIITEFSRFDLTRWLIETKQFLKDGGVEK